MTKKQIEAKLTGIIPKDMIERAIAYIDLTEISVEEYLEVLLEENEVVEE